MICAGPEAYIAESFRLSRGFTEGLLERGVVVVPFSSDGNLPEFEYEEESVGGRDRKRLWQLRTYDVSAWSE